MCDSILHDKVNSIVNDEKDVSKVVGKVREIERLMTLKISQQVLKNGYSSRQEIAIEMACRILKVPFNRHKIMQISPSSDKDYSQALIICKNILKIHWDDAIIEVLSVKFGASLNADSIELLDRYQSLYIDKLDCNSSKSYINIQSSVYAAAAFYICAKLKKVTLDKEQLIKIAQVNKDLLINIVDSISERLNLEGTTWNPVTHKVNRSSNTDSTSKNKNRRLSADGSCGQKTGYGRVDDNYDNYHLQDRLCYDQHQHVTKENVSVSDGSNLSIANTHNSSSCSSSSSNNCNSHINLLVTSSPSTSKQQTITNRIILGKKREADDNQLNNKQFNALGISYPSNLESDIHQMQREQQLLQVKINREKYEKLKEKTLSAHRSSKSSGNNDTDDANMTNSIHKRMKT